jgi:hypothetical protein
MKSVMKSLSTKYNPLLLTFPLLKNKNKPEAFKWQNVGRVYGGRELKSKLLTTWFRYTTCFRKKYINFNQRQISLRTTKLLRTTFFEINFHFTILPYHKLTSCLFSSYVIQWRWPWNSSFCIICAKHHCVFRIKFFALRPR